MKGMYLFISHPFLPRGTPTRFQIVAPPPPSPSRCGSDVHLHPRTKAKDDIVTAYMAPRVITPKHLQKATSKLNTKPTLLALVVLNR